MIFLEISLEDLRRNSSGTDYESGYRIVYLDKNGYTVGEYCKSIEGFMLGFCESYPIYDEDDIPPFLSTQDLLQRYLDDFPSILGVFLYDVDGNCIDKLYRKN